MLKKSFIIDQFNEIEIKKNSNKKINQVLPFFSLVTRIFVLTILEKKKISLLHLSNYSSLFERLETRLISMKNLFVIQSIS